MLLLVAYLPIKTVQVREAVEKSNERAYGEKRVLRFYDVSPVPQKEDEIAVSN
jgi:hypothetical protein